MKEYFTLNYTLSSYQIYIYLSIFIHQIKFPNIENQIKRVPKKKINFQSHDN